MKPITLEDYLPLTEESCSMLLSDMQHHLTDFIEEQIIVKQKEGIAREYFSEKNAIGRFYEHLAYQKNTLNNGEHKTFLDELLELETPNSYNEIYVRELFLSRLYHTLDLSNLEKNVLNTPLTKDSFSILEKHLEQSKELSPSTIKSILMKQMTQDTLVNLFYYSILNPKKSLSYYAAQIQNNLNNITTLTTVLHEYWTEFSFSTLREQLALFSVIPLVFNKKEPHSKEIDNLLGAFYNILYDNTDIIDSNAMIVVLIELSTQFFDLESINGNKQSLNQFDPYISSDKDFIHALRLFRDEKLLKHLLPYQQTLALYKDISLKVKGKDEPQSRKNKI